MPLVAVLDARFHLDFIPPPSPFAMSARAPFLFGNKEKETSANDGGGDNTNPRIRTDVQPSAPLVRAPLNDASNSPRPGRQNDLTTTFPANDPANAKSASTARPFGRLLNVSTLKGNKGKKLGDAPVNQTKKLRTMAVVKESGSTAHTGFPNSPMSHRNDAADQNSAPPFMSNATEMSSLDAHGGSRLTHARVQSLSGIAFQAQTPAGNLRNKQDLRNSRVPIATPRRGNESLASSTSTLHSPPSPTSGLNLDPSEREVFPLTVGKQINAAHIRSSLSPRASKQRQSGDDHIYDIQIPLDQPLSGKELTPIDVDDIDAMDNASDQGGQKYLRRATKRIGQAYEDEEFVYPGEGKRRKMDTQANEVNVLQLTESRCLPFA